MDHLGMCLKFFMATIILSIMPIFGTLSVRAASMDFGYRSEHEFSIFVSALEEMCFFQPVKKGARLHADFEVFRGGDGKANFYVRNSEGDYVVENENEQDHGRISVPVEREDVLEICLENPSRTGRAKLIYLSIDVYYENEWENYRLEIKELHVREKQFITSLNDVEHSLQEVYKHQLTSRMTTLRDSHQVRANKQYILIWSLSQCALIVAATVAQVVVLRRLFQERNVTPNFKPRA